MKGIKSKQKECMFEGCGQQKVYARGVCLYHYYLLRSQVNKGRYSWKYLAEIGTAEN